FSVAAGGLLGGTINGVTALANNRTFFTGSIRPQPITPNYSLIPKPELHTELQVESPTIRSIGERPQFNSGNSLNSVNETKAITQFSGATIDDATSLTISQKGNHIFSNNIHPKPWLNQLSTKMGGEQNVIKAAFESANGRIIPDVNGIFNTQVRINNVDFMIRGYLNKSAPVINTIFIPKR
ncbi:MAG: hypothetical protein LBG92_04300, partial [Prevotellaceae bacterium]|nr:hypothetical protein [Prevotellaceae bacterium]